MLSVFAFKVLLLSVLPHIITLNKNPHYAGIVTSYTDVVDASSIEATTFKVPSWDTEIRIVKNRTHKFVLADVPQTLHLCDLVSYFAPLLICDDVHVVMRDAFIISRDTSLVDGIFGLQGIRLDDPEYIYSLSISNAYDQAYIEQSFLQLIVNNTSPIPISESCREEEGCRVNPDWKSQMREAQDSSELSKLWIYPYVCRYINHKIQYYLSFSLYVIRTQGRKWYFNFNRRIDKADSRPKSDETEN